ncbi:MAG: conserved hypothetical protein [Methanobrevibacter sp. CfCl-M3]
MSELIEIMGLFCTVFGIVTALSAIIHIKKILVAKNTESTSIISILFFTVNVYGWTIYGVVISDWPLMVVNTLGSVIYTVWLGAILYYRNIRSYFFI